MRSEKVYLQDMVEALRELAAFVKGADPRMRNVFWSSDAPASLKLKYPDTRLPADSDLLAPA